MRELISNSSHAPSVPDTGKELFFRITPNEENKSLSIDTVVRADLAQLPWPRICCKTFTATLLVDPITFLLRRLRRVQLPLLIP